MYKLFYCLVFYLILQIKITNKISVIYIELGPGCGCWSSSLCHPSDQLQTTRTHTHTRACDSFVGRAKPRALWLFWLFWICWLSHDFHIKHTAQIHLVFICMLVRWLCVCMCVCSLPALRIKHRTNPTTSSQPFNLSILLMYIVYDYMRLPRLSVRVSQAQIAHVLSLLVSSYKYICRLQSGHEMV